MSVVDIGLRCGLSNCARAASRATRQTVLSAVSWTYNESCVIYLRTASGYARINSPSTYCVDLVRKYDYENYLALLLLPQSLRRTAFAIRAFNVELSQIKDMTSTTAIGEMRIQFWRDALDRIYSGKPPQQPVSLELAYALNSVALSKHWLKRLIDSRSARLSDQPFESLQEIENYSENSVSTVYFLLLEALSLKNIHADHTASHIGKAQGVANFIRGMPYYLKRQKVLLPNDIMIKHKVSHEQILRGSNEHHLQNIVFDIASVAHRHVEMARNLKKNVPDTAFVVFLPLISTGEYLVALQKAHFNPFYPNLQVRNTWLPCKLWWNKLRRRY